MAATIYCAPCQQVSKVVIVIVLTLQRGSSTVVPVINVHITLLAPGLDIVNIVIDNGLAKLPRRANVSHVSPFFGAQWVEAADFLTSWIIFQEGDLSFYVDGILLLHDLTVLVIERLWAKSAAVVHNVANLAKENRVAVKIDCSVRRAVLRVPFTVQQEISLKKQLFQPFGCEIRSVRDGELEIVALAVRFEAPLGKAIGGPLL